MATYAIGDIHGCYDQLQQLLAKIDFDLANDTLWFTGDLINGGPKPAETLRFISKLGDKCVCILGNHDLVLLGVAAGKLPAPTDRKIGFEPILDAPDRDQLLNWLRARPLVHYDPKFNALLVHAGVLPNWNLQQIITLAHEVENTLRSDKIELLLDNMYGNEPDTWSDNLTNWDRLRFIINCFTRMRFCDANGKLELKSKGDTQDGPIDYLPWFKIPTRKTADINIIFGHWAALRGITNEANVFAIDTGCVWGESLTALRLDDWQLFSISNNS